MKWAFGIRRKISAALLLSAIFVLLFVKNMVDSNHVTILGKGGAQWDVSLASKASIAESILDRVEAALV